MVCDAAMIASTVASLLMNGVCCMYQMQEEDERREAIRRDIRVEYERQRLLDLEQWAERKACDKLQHNGSSIQDVRRRDLIVRKMDVASDARREIGQQARDSSVNGRCRIDLHTAPDDSRRDREQVRCEASVGGGKSVMSDQAVLHNEFMRPKSTKAVQSPPAKKLYNARRLGQHKAAAAAACDNSSLFDFGDSDLEDDEDEQLSLVDVALH